MNTRDAIVELQRTVRLAATQAIAKFELETGVTPSAIDIHMLDVSTMGDPRRSVVGEVRVRIEQ